MPLDDATAEALLAGRDLGYDAGHDLEQLRQVVLAYRDTARLPVPPRGELAVRMATGAFRPPARRTASGSQRRTRSSDRTEPPHQLTNQGRRIRAAVTTRLTATAAKLAGLSLVAKAAAGVTVATAGITTAGASGMLPDPAQDRFDRVVETVTGGDESPAPDDPGGDAEFGERVGEDGDVHGGERSEEPEEPEKSEKLRDGHLPDGTPDEPTDPPTPDEGHTVPDQPTAVPDDPGANVPTDLPTAVPDDPGAVVPTAPPGR